jgi:hypothetical protein
MRNVSVPALCLTAVTTLAASRHTQAVKTQPDVPFTATVSASEARFFFPLEERREWIWYLSTTPDNRREYEWSAEVENGGTRYQFGFFLFKAQGRAPARGDFSALIRAGQTSVATAVGAAPHTRMIVLQNGRVNIAQGRGLLVVSITDPETLRTLFSERPPLVTLKMQVPEAAEVTRSVKTTYPGRNR